MSNIDKKIDNMTSKEINNYKHNNKWWSKGGGYDGLHSMNSIRITFIKSAIKSIIRDIRIKNNEKDIDNIDFSEYSILDAGCGGGILSQPLSNLGFNVIGVDRNIEAIKIARDQDSNAEFINCDIMEIDRKFDFVIASEVIEHVDDYDEFFKHISQLSNYGVVISTINRTLSALMKVIYICETLRIIEPGTHQWKKFISPSELNTVANKYEMEFVNMKGLKYNILNDSWRFSADLSINYIAAYQKNNYKIQK